MHHASGLRAPRPVAPRYPVEVVVLAAGGQTRTFIHLRGGDLATSQCERGLHVVPSTESHLVHVVVLADLNEASSEQLRCSCLRYRVVLVLVAHSHWCTVIKPPLFCVAHRDRCGTMGTRLSARPLFSHPNVF